MIAITPSIAIDEKEISEHFIHASGPGGQNINKVATAVQLRFPVIDSPSLPYRVKQRLMRIAGKRVTAEGVLIIEARRYRTQLQNRRDAMERLVSMVRLAAERPQPRRKTRPPLVSKKRRLEKKRKRSHLKKMRGKVSAEEG